MVTINSPDGVLPQWFSPFLNKSLVSNLISVAFNLFGDLFVLPRLLHVNWLNWLIWLNYLIKLPKGSIYSQPITNDLEFWTCFLEVHWIWTLDVLLRGPMDLNFGRASQRFIDLNFGRASQRFNGFVFGRASQRFDWFEIWTCFPKVFWIWILDVLPKSPMI